MSTLTFDEHTVVITRITTAQNELLDYTGHVNKGLPRARARELATTINDLRASIGWKTLDMGGRWGR